MLLAPGGNARSYVLEPPVGRQSPTVGRPITRQSEGSRPVNFPRSLRTISRMKQVIAFVVELIKPHSIRDSGLIPGSKPVQMPHWHVEVEWTVECPIHVGTEVCWTEQHESVDAAQKKNSVLWVHFGDAECTQRPVRRKSYWEFPKLSHITGSEARGTEVGYIRVGPEISMKKTYTLVWNGTKVIWTGRHTPTPKDYEYNSSSDVTGVSVCPVKFKNFT